MGEQRKILKRYHSLRGRLRKHQNAAVSQVSHSAFRRHARSFELLDGNQLMLESESELTVLMDFCIYFRGGKGKSVVQRYLAKLPPADDVDEQAIRTAMLNARYSLFEIQEVRKGIGVTMSDLIRRDSLSVVDRGMSKSLRPQNVLAGRFIPLPDFWMSTGAIFGAGELMIATCEERLEPLVDRVWPDGRIVLSAAQQGDLERLAISIGLAEGTIAEARYE